MKSGNGKNIKKAFTYFIGVYFILSGVLISGGNVMAGKKEGESCTIFSDCGTAGYGLNGALMKCDYAAPNVSSFKTCMYSSPTAILTDTSGANPLLKEDYTPVKQVKTADPLKFTPQVEIPNTSISGTVSVGSQVGTKMVSTLLPTYIGSFYKYGLTIVGILATVILMAGGIVWLTSAGNDSRVTQAKEMIFSSLAGIFLLYGSYIILNTINPDLVNLKAIESPSIAQVTLDIVCCQTTSGAEITEAKDCKGSKMTGYIVNGGVCVKMGCSIHKDKKGTSCFNTIESFFEVWNPNGVPNVFKPTPCSKIDECKNNIVDDCKEAEDADGCRISPMSGICYNHQCYIGPGKDGEPCGNDKGSACLDEDKGSCENIDQGGRDCDHGSCCLKVKENTCSGKMDGADCNTDTTKGYCYNSKCLTKKGKAGEQCGDDGGKCKETTATDWCLRQDAGGRNCDGFNNLCCLDYKNN